MYLYDKYTIVHFWRMTMEIIISNNKSSPIYEQITSQIKAFIMNGELQTGDPLPSMRALAKSLHISVITVQRAYEDLQRDGFIETVTGRGSFVAAQNKDFIKEEQLRNIEKKLEEAANLGRTHGIKLEKLIELLRIFYVEEE
ncbi:transcriptional regulator, gntR family [Clostridium tetani E88]|uniref:Transcriptional regulator, gntR family n=2 Tax=Clostridium tetani TaxID=1513 RepID=Q893D4_CLOTE|nr:transcriptional regulator, gntR family [Clostridium tetani E88]